MATVVDDVPTRNKKVKENFKIPAFAARAAFVAVGVAVANRGRVKNN